MGWVNRSAAAVWEAGRWIATLGTSSRERRNATDISALLLAALGFQTRSGMTVSVDTALRVTTVLACARVLAEGTAQIPWKLRQKVDGKNVDADGHALSDIISARPNDWDTSFTFRETLLYHAVLTGNAFAFVNRVRGGIKEIIPIPPGYVKVDRASDYELTYTITGPQGKIGDYGRDQILHLRGPSWNGYTGMDVIGLSREPIGLAMALEASQGALHKNGLQPSIVFTNDKDRDEAQIKRIKALIKVTHSGAENVFKPLFLDAGWKAEKLSMSGVDAQTMEARRFQLEEICRAMGVFPQSIGHTDKTATFASAEAFFIAHVVNKLTPWIERFEQTCYRDLLTQEERAAGYYFHMPVEGLLRGDSKSRSAFYQVMVLTGILTRNECRILEDRNPLEGLDDPLVPLNMGVAGAADGGAGSDGTPLPPTLMPNIPIAPQSLVGRLLGHNGGPPLDDDGRKAIAAALPRLQAMRRGEKLAKGRVLSAENEALIREAAGLIDQADLKLTAVLDKLEAAPDTED